jgi:hypothetical protein
MTEQQDPLAMRDPIDQLRAELEAVAAPEHFADRVRERMGRVPGSRFRVPGSRFGFRLGAVAAAVVLLLWSEWWASVPVKHVAETHHVRVVPAPADGSRTIRIPPVRSAPRPTPPEPGTRNQEPGTRNLEPGTRNQEPGTGNLEPNFEVLTNQPAILAEIWARTARTARAGVAAPIDATPVAPEIDIASVEVSPVVVKWLVDPAPAVGFPLPFIVRIAAAEAARRPE